MDAPWSIPPNLAWLEEHEAGREWLAAVPRLVASATARWSLDLGPPFADAYVSSAAAATRPDGSSVVLKLPFPDRETRHEAAALRIWAGEGAIRLLDHDPETGAMLLERCRPGTPLAARPAEEALEVLAGLLPRLWVPVDDLPTLAAEAAWWTTRLPATWEAAGRPFDRRLVDAALSAMDELAPTQQESVLLHQDLHAGNVLAAEREPWLVIDPKPLVGERAFGLAPIVRGGALGHSRHEVLARLDRLSGSLGVDRERARRWTIAQTLAWAFENDRALPDHVEAVEWLLEA